MSIRVRVLLHANLREIVGKREVIEEINSNSTLRDILDKLAQRYGRDFKQIVDPGTGAISLEFLVSINGRIMRDANVKLNDDGVLILSIPIGGG